MELYVVVDDRIILIPEKTKVRACTPIEDLTFWMVNEETCAVAIEEWHRIEMVKVNSFIKIAYWRMKEMYIFIFQSGKEAEDFIFWQKNQTKNVLTKIRYMPL